MSNYSCEDLRRIYPIVGRLGAGSSAVRRYLWARYFGFEGNLAGKSEKQIESFFRTKLENVIGEELPEEIEKGFWLTRETGVSQELQTMEKTRRAGMPLRREGKGFAVK